MGKVKHATTGGATIFKDFRRILLDCSVINISGKIYNPQCKLNLGVSKKILIKTT